jgi:hypothetical protein
MNLSTYKLDVVFLTPVLGSQPTRDIASEFIAKKAGFDSRLAGGIPADELDTLPEVLERGTTVFHRAKDGSPLLWNYQVLGFLKEAARATNGRVAGNVRNLRSKVEQHVFVSPRIIPLKLPSGGELDYLERPLRAEGAMGPRVALSRSEMLPEGTAFTCGITVFPGDITEAVLTDLLDYGMFKGIGQWRGGSYGQFRYTLTAEA